MTLEIPSTGGTLAAPAANAVLADTGALIAGIYSVYIDIGQTNVVNSGDFTIQRRDAANATSLWEIKSGLRGSDFSKAWQLTMRLEENERIRVVETSLGSYTVRANIWTQRLGA